MPLFNIKLKADASELQRGFKFLEKTLNQEKLVVAGYKTAYTKLDAQHKAAAELAEQEAKAHTEAVKALKYISA